MKNTKFIKIGAGVFVALMLVFSTGVLAINQNKQSINEEFVNVGENYLELLKTDVPDFEDMYIGEIPLAWEPDGVYVGVWGDFDGENFTVYGYLAGYYKANSQKRGSYVGVWNTTDNATTGWMAGIFRSIFTFGVINVTDGNQFPIVGFLVKNETLFAGRIMAPVGPPVYMFGIHQPLDRGETSIVTLSSTTNHNVQAHRSSQRLNNNLINLISRTQK